MVKDFVVARAQGKHGMDTKRCCRMRWAKGVDKMWLLFVQHSILLHICIYSLHDS